jgi:hypothetical protein
MPDDPRLPCGHPNYVTSSGRYASEMGYACPCTQGYYHDRGQWRYSVAAQHPTGAAPQPSADDYGKEVHGG